MQILKLWMHFTYISLYHCSYLRKWDILGDRGTVMKTNKCSSLKLMGLTSHWIVSELSNVHSRNVPPHLARSTQWPTGGGPEVSQPHRWARAWGNSQGRASVQGRLPSRLVWCRTVCWLLQSYLMSCLTLKCHVHVIHSKEIWVLIQQWVMALCRTSAQAFLQTLPTSC